MNISVAGVAERNGKVLIALRNPGTSIGTRWEFPGGKVEDGESAEEALTREYNEELSISISVNDRLCEGEFSNGDKNYRLLVYSIELGSDDFKSEEHQEIRWVDIINLRDFDFPDSDKIIVNYLLSR